MILDGIAQRIPKRIRKSMPITANSLDEFITLLKQKGATYVDVMPKTTVEDKDDVVLGTTYSAEYRSETRNNRPIIFNEEFGPCEYHPDVESNSIDLKMIISIDKRAQSLRNKIRKDLPEVRVDVLCSFGRIEPILKERIYRDAKTYAIEPFLGVTTN